MALPAILAGVGGSIVATLKFTEHPMIAYLIVILFLIGDGAISALTGWTGVAGSLVSFIINQLIAPLSIEVYSWQVLILVACFPVIIWIWNSSANS